MTSNVPFEMVDEEAFDDVVVFLTFDERSYNEVHWNERRRAHVSRTDGKARSLTYRIIVDIMVFKIDPLSIEIIGRKLISGDVCGQSEKERCGVVDGKAVDLP
jgi:hypothetical protein